MTQAHDGGRRRRLPPWIRLPPVMGTLRWRLTALYGVLFLVSGAVLLLISGGYVVNSSSHTAVAPAPSGPSSASGQLAGDRALIRQLQHELATQASSGPSSLSHRLLAASAIALGFMTIGSVLMGWLLAGRALRPVRQMTSATQQISAHNLDERLAVTGPADELKALGDTIDGLLERLEAAFSAQRRFVANASHELRTPLTTIRASVDVAVAKPEGVPPQTMALASRVRAELDRIDSLLEAFLVLARAQHQNLLGYALLPLDYVVGAALADQQVAIRARNLTVQDSTAPGGAWVRGNQALLSRLVQNLIENAVRHNQDGGWIHVTAATEAGWARLVVENGGQVLEQRQGDELTQPSGGSRRTASARTRAPAWACRSSRPLPRRTTGDLTCKPGPAAGCGYASTCRLPPPPTRSPRPVCGHEGPGRRGLKVPRRGPGRGPARSGHGGRRRARRAGGGSQARSEPL